MQVKNVDLCLEPSSVLFELHSETTGPSRFDFIKSGPINRAGLLAKLNFCDGLLDL